ncbi:MAG: GNAT family N-acetyltransferase [candidate division Zixibacteria bacterium]|nr:GNAT family N-acetyltransferase [candidate division Zixibacteria bacterium]
MHQKADANSPFELNLTFNNPIRQAAFSLLKQPLEKLFKLDAINQYYSEAHCPESDCQFINKVLELLNVHYHISDEDRVKIPEEGPAIVVANHPFGAIEGLVLASLLTSIRQDAKIMANYLLYRIDEIKPFIIPVDPFGSVNSRKRNLHSLREAFNWLKDGGILGIFPAGEVSHLKIGRREVIDPEWSFTVAKLIRKTEAPVVPVFFEGRNSNLFQLLGLINKRLRTAMLPKELLNKQNKDLPIRVGNIIPYKKLGKFQCHADLMEYIRFRTYLLARRPPNRTETVSDTPNRHSEKRLSVPVAQPKPVSRLSNEINRLPEDRLLTMSDEYAVYFAELKEAPNIIYEIGRCRELTFREVGEGTGKNLDLDRFDDYYIHLFVWNKSEREIVGAYRLGMIDKIVEQYGVKGLYTRTLFKYKTGLLKQLGASIELGRSFILPKYQKEFSPLQLLWKGIARIVIMNPRYKMLLGPVSISNSYNSVSQQLMVRFLTANNLDMQLSRLVKPITPHRKRKTGGLIEKATDRLVTDISEVSSLIAEIENNSSGIPVLLRQYLKLGGRILGFNIDPEFSDVLDALILVDLIQTPHRTLQKYFGKTEAAKFMEFHGIRIQSDNNANIGLTA